MVTKSKRLRSSLLVAFLVTLPGGLQAVPSPKQVIQDGAEKVRVILRKKSKQGSPEEKKQKEELKRVVDGFLDYGELSRRSLGPHWKNRTDAEQGEFTGLLRDLIEESYTKSIRKNIEFTMDYQDEEIAGDGTTASVATVASAKNRKGKTVSEDLTFHLFLKNRNWTVYDVEFGDVSLVRHYRGEFNRKIKKESYPALIKAMRKKLADIKAGRVKVEKQPKL